MGRQKISEQNIRNLQKNNRSYFIRLPIELVRLFGWRDGQKLVVEIFGKDGLVIKDWKKNDRK